MYRDHTITAPKSLGHRGRASLVCRAAGDARRYISGGMTLIPTMKARLAAPSDLVDLAAYRRS